MPKAGRSRLRQAIGRMCCVLTAATIAAIALPAQADLISPYGGETAPNFAEVRVLEDRVRIALEIDVSDYPIFVEADDGTGRSLAERTGRTLTISANGVKIKPVTRHVDVRKRKPRVTSARQLAVAARRESSDQVIYAELDFMFADHPKALTLAPPLEADGMPAASVGMLVEHVGVPVSDYRYLSAPETLLLNWEDPWFSTFKNPNLARHQKSPLMSFISIEPREVRHEITFRLRDLETWVDLGLGSADTLTAAQIEEVKRRAATFLARRNPITVDGTVLFPSDSRVSQLSIGVAGLSVLEDIATTKRATALFGVVLSYPLDALPSQLSMTWDLFPDGTQSVPVQVTDPAGGLPGRVMLGDPTITWTNFLRNWQEPATRAITLGARKGFAFPYLTAIFAAMGFGAAFPILRRRGVARRAGWGAAAVAALVAAAFAIPVKATVPMPSDGRPDRVTAERIMSAALENISAAMLETRKPAFEAALAPFVLPDASSAVGTEIRRGLSVMLPSGARARTEAVRDLRVEKITETGGGHGHQFLASWSAEVSGDHWGHLHRRLVRYRALVDVIQMDGDWYVGGLSVLSSQTRS
jgi:hypothetical protein